jgi:hypothetical protein
MGKRKSDSGVTMTFYDASGQAIPGSSKHYLEVNLLGLTPPAEQPNPGSDDWLHDVYLADTSKNLGELYRQFPPESKTPPLTSGSSPHVRVFTAETSNGQIVMNKYLDQYVVATNNNPLMTADERKVIVEELLVSATSPNDNPQDSPFVCAWGKEIRNLTTQNVEGVLEDIERRRK